MSAAPLPPDEEGRLRALRRSGLLDSAPDPSFDDFTRLAAFICDTPIALVSLVDADRQWFKSKVGLDVAETPRGDAFCAHAILERGVTMVPDSHADPRFADNPLVQHEPKIRFYAGAPLVTPEGYALGTLCVIDRKPRTLEKAQLEALQALARQVVTYVELRMRTGDLDRSTRELERTQLASRTASRAVQSLLNLQRAIFDGANHAIVACAPEGTILSFNKAAARMLGYEASEVVGSASLTLFHDPKEMVRRARELSEELGQPIEPGFETFSAKARRGVPDEREWSLVRKDGTSFPALSTVTALKDQAGQLTGFVELAQDITERKQVEQMKNEFVSIVSHELRTPLTSIRGALGLLEGGVLGDLSAEAKEMIAIARQNSDRLIRLINDILDLDKIEAGKMELVHTRLDAGELARAALEGIRAYADTASVELRASVPDKLALFGDRDRLLQVLTNLLSNAIKFSPAQGVVTLRAEAVGANLRFSIADSGPGIPEHQRNLLFRKFQQLDASDTRRKGGTGLGLAISKAIVEQHRGRIWIESVPGKGAVFFFELPRRALQQQTSPGALPAPNGPRVLVVEDDIDLQAVVLQTLASVGFRAEGAGSLAEARERLQLFRPDAVLLDLALPDGSGLDLLEEMRRDPRTAEVPVLVVSGTQRALAGPGGSEPGAPQLVDWVVKPFQETQLVTALRRALRREGAAQVLLVDDDERARELLGAHLATLGVTALHAPDVASAAAMLLARAPDLVLLGMPEAGAELLTALGNYQRETGRATPLLLYGDRELSAEDKRRSAPSSIKNLPKGAGTQEEFLRAVRDLVTQLEPATRRQGP